MQRCAAARFHILFTHQMLITTDLFIVLKSNHLVQTVDPSCNSFWDIPVTPGHEENLMKNLPCKNFAGLLVCVQNLVESYWKLPRFKTNPWLFAAMYRS